MLMESNCLMRRGKPQTDPRLLLSSKWNIIIQHVVLIDPDLSGNHQRMVTYMGPQVLRSIRTVPASRAEETLMHWFASSIQSMGYESMLDR